MLGIFKRNKRSQEESEAYNLLLQLKVYPYGVKKSDFPPLATHSDDTFVTFVYSRPRVQVSAKAKLAKRILLWQDKVRRTYGAEPATEFPSLQSEREEVTDGNEEAA